MGENQIFTLHKFVLQPAESIFLFSDGYKDQLGGTHGKTFKSGRFNELLLKIQPLDPEEQKAMLEKRLQEWMAGYEQTDDILVFSAVPGRKS